MTAETRMGLRVLIDARRRELLEEKPAGPTCKRCGTHVDNHTKGCKRCWERHRQRRRWAADSDYRAHYNALRKSRAKKEAA